MQHLLDNCYYISVLILLLSGFVHSTEFLFVPRAYNNLIYFNEDNSTARYSLYNPAVRKVFHMVQSCLVIAALTVLLVTRISLAFKILFFVLSLSVLYAYVRRRTGRDGADQVRLLAFLSYSLCFFIQDEYSKILPLLFLGFQLLVSYTTSGMAKLLSPYWRKGNVLADILSTHSYGNKAFSAWLKQHPRLEKFFSHLAIFFMLFVLVAFLLPWPQVLLVSLGCMFCFHLTVAFLMKLNDFLITIPLLYPAIFFLHQWIYVY